MDVYETYSDFKADNINQELSDYIELKALSHWTIDHGVPGSNPPGTFSQMSNSSMFSYNFLRDLSQECFLI